MTSSQRIREIHDRAASEIETPIQGLDPKYKRSAVSVFLTRADLKALAVVLRAIAKAEGKP